MHHNQYDEEVKMATGKRMNLLFMLIFVALAVLIFRLSFIQLAHGEEYLRKAETNRYIRQSVPTPRGMIYDRDHNLLVTNKPASTITFQILSADVQDPRKIAAMLAPALGKTPDEVVAAMDLHGKRYMYSMARKLTTNATSEQIAFIREHQSELPGVNVVLEPIRDYLRGNFASHILGYLHNITPEYWEAHRNEYQQTDVVGMAGVEGSYEKELRGKKGMLQVEVNIYNQPLNDQRLENPVKGDDLVLTIDSRLQQATEAALAERVRTLSKRVRTVQNAAAIAMNPKTGEILAMASYPSYDPNIWIRGVKDKEYQAFAPAEMNRALQQVYQPGSTIKMATELIGMKEAVIHPHTVIPDPGRIQVGYLPNGEPNYIKSWKAIGYPDAHRALAESSNVYMIRTFLNLANYRENMPSAQVNQFLAQRLPQTMDKILRYHAELGLGKVKTGVDLPYEETGKITQEGLVSDLAFAAIGQTEDYTLMQLAQYVSTIANNGKRMQPYVVGERITPGQQQPIKRVPVVQNQVSFTPDQLRTVQQGMYDATNKTYGTFYSVFGHYPVKVAGKTGTAETGRGTENSLFVGYAPYDDPQIAIAIIIPDNERNNHSSDTLGPIARAMMDAWFNRPALK